MTPRRRRPRHGEDVLLRRSLILPAPVPASPQQDIDTAATAEALNFEVVWVRDRPTAPALPTLGSLAAGTSRIGLGLGPSSLWGRLVDDVAGPIRTLAMVAPNRVHVTLETPTVDPRNEPARWPPRLLDATAAAHRLAVSTAAEVHDLRTAVLAAPSTDRIVLRGADAETADRVVAAVRAQNDDPPPVEVWLDLAVDGPGRDAVRALVAERLVVPGIGGSTLARAAAGRDHPDLVADVEVAYAAGALSEAVDLVPEDFVGRTALTDRDAMLRARLDAYGAAGVDTVAVLPHAADHAGRLAALSHFAEASAAGDPTR